MFILLTNSVFSQVVFDSVDPFIGGSNSSGGIALGDIDGDGDADALSIEWTGLASETNLYTNDGAGNFSLVFTSPFTGVSAGSVDFVDIDGDNDLDVFITGSNASSEISRLYKNDGLGNFSFVSNSITGVYFGSTAFADVDGDTDLDLIICGDNSSFGEVTELYLNDGTGSFTLSGTNSFTGMKFADVAFGDMDGDNDNDLLIAGFTGSNNIAQLFVNDGSGSFSLSMNQPFPATQKCKIEFDDIDSDLDQDVIMVGEFGLHTVYENDGTGIFIEKNDSLFPGRVLDFKIADLDLDGDNDLLLTGITESTGSLVWGTSYVQINDGAGNFSNSYEEMYLQLQEKIVVGDVDIDGDLDFLVQGNPSGGTSGYHDIQLAFNVCQKTNCVLDTNIVCVNDSYLFDDGGSVIIAGDSVVVHSYQTSQGVDSAFVEFVFVDDMGIEASSDKSCSLQRIRLCYKLLVI